MLNLLGFARFAWRDLRFNRALCLRRVARVSAGTLCMDRSDGAAGVFADARAPHAYVRARIASRLVYHLASEVVWGFAKTTARMYQ